MTAYLTLRSSGSDAKTEGRDVPRHGDSAGATRWQSLVALVSKTYVQARKWRGRRGLSRPPPEMTVRRKPGGRQPARWC